MSDAPSDQTPVLAADGWIRGRAPTDGHDLEPVATTTPEDVRDLVIAARAAQPAWEALGLKERSRRMVRAAKRMLARRDEAVALLRDEIGKHEADALMSEVIGPLDQVRQWSKLLKRHGGRRKVFVNPLGFPGKRASVELVPRGVVGAITPWNYPLGTFFRPALPALLAGNGLVIKPSEYAPRTARWFVEQLRAEIPDDIVQLAFGGADVGRALLEAGVDAMTFTGSVGAGREVSKRCGELLIPVSVELGGNDAAIVLADCDLDRTLAGVTHWALHNAGQNCGAIERVYVVDAIADPFVDRLAASWSKLSTTPGPDIDVSPLANEPQLAIVERHVEDARTKGADVRTGGERTGHGLGYAPTILDNCTPAMDVVNEETFGPVLAITRVKDAEEALRHANVSDYGLGGSIWTTDRAEGERLAARLQCGVLNVNNHAVSGAMVGVPWTGVKDTGHGIANSQYALTTFLRPRTWLVDKSTKPDLFWMPFDATLVDVGHRLAKLQLGKVGAAPKLLGAVKRRIRTVREFFGRDG